MAIYTAYNGAMPTTAEITKVATGAAIKTMLQVATPATRGLQVISYGMSFDASAAATPGTVELIQTDVGATVTAHTSTGIVAADPTNTAGSAVTLGTGATGFTATAEGTTAASRLLDFQLVAPTNQWVLQFPGDDRPLVGVSKFLRLRVHFGTTVNVVCWITWAE